VQFQAVLLFMTVFPCNAKLVAKITKVPSLGLIPHRILCSCMFQNKSMRVNPAEPRLSHVSEPSLQQSELKFCFTEYTNQATTVLVGPILFRREEGKHTRILSVFGISIPNVQIPQEQW
jgi:hypothetical protein